MRTLLEKVQQGKIHGATRFRTVSLLSNEAVAVDINNVVEWLPDDLVVSKYWPLVEPRLPFPVMFLEWRQPVIHNDGYEHIEDSGLLLMDTYQLDRLEKGTGEGYEDCLSYVAYMSCMNVDCVGGGVIQFENGEVNDIHYDKGPAEELPPDFYHDKWQTCMDGFSTLLTATLAFFACKNVQVRRLERSKKAVKHYTRKFGIAPPEYHVIEIHKQTVRNVYEGGISGTAPARHATVIKGHHKIFTAERPLFGKIAGKFFWPSHVRGEIGTPTLNDYRVWPPQHKGDCIQ